MPHGRKAGSRSRRAQKPAQRVVAEKKPHQSERDTSKQEVAVDRLEPPDNGIEKLRAIREDFDKFIATAGEASEADTRVKLVDRILTEVCGWPEASIRREHHTNSGYLDYELFVHNRPHVTVEAKRAGRAFVFPHGEGHRSLKISGALLTQDEIRAAINQVRSYCDDEGIRYAVATNGSAWIVFRAIREDMKWRDGTARIFPSIDHIIENFTDFWNLLSYDAVSAGRLDSEFGVIHRVPRGLHRVIDRLFNADVPLQRNRLHAQLFPLIRLVFEDIADQDQLDVLQRCYVHSESLRVAATDINLTITDTIPSFLADQGAEPLKQDERSAGNFGTVLEGGVAGTRGQLLLLLGGIGSGKTTFLKRYQRDVGAKVLNDRAIWFYIDFLGAPLDPLAMEPFVWRELLSQMRVKYKSPHLETRRNIKRIFKSELEALQETKFNYLRVGSPQYESDLTVLREVAGGSRRLCPALAESREAAPGTRSCVIHR
jgi:hypothetical protein